MTIHGTLKSTDNEIAKESLGNPLKNKHISKKLIIASLILFMSVAIFDFDKNKSSSDELSFSSTSISNFERKVITKILKELKTENKIKNSKSIRRFEFIGTSDYTNNLIENSTLEHSENGQDIIEITLIDITESNKKRIIAQFSLRDKKSNNVRFEKSTYL